MSTGWKPEEYTDDYREALKDLIEEKIEHGDKATPAPTKKKRPSNVVDLVAILQKSIQETGHVVKTAKTDEQEREIENRFETQEGRLVNSCTRQDGSPVGERLCRWQ